MYLYEYQAKRLLKEYGVDVPSSVFIEAESLFQGSEQDLKKGLDAHLSDRVVVKVQILEGGRGKRGGVVAVSRGEALREARRMLREWRGAAGVLVEEYVPHSEEYYLSLLLDRERRGITLLASRGGGVDVEESEDVLSLQVDPFTGPLPHHRRMLESHFGAVPADLLEKLFKLFTERDLTLLEINPLILSGGRAVALDAKVTCDLAALYRSRLPENPEQYTPLELAGRRAGLAVLEMEGRCAVMANGAGLTMATLDYLASLGISPRLFLDLSGTDDPEKVREAFHIALRTSPEAILVNIFSGMTRADTVAEGILRGMEETSVEVPVIVRLHGTNYEIGRRMLRERGVHVYETLPEAAEHLRALLEGG